MWSAGRGSGLSAKENRAEGTELFWYNDGALGARNHRRKSNLVMGTVRLGVGESGPVETISGEGAQVS